MRLDGHLTRAAEGEIPVPVFILPEEGLKLLEERAVYIFNAMTWGFHFVYTPSWKNRSIEEVLILEPIVHKFNPDLENLGFSLKGLFLSSSFLMNWSESEQSYQERWQSLKIPMSSGRAEMPFHDFEKNYNDLFSLAVKDALRSYLRKEDFNRPREVSGHILLADYPVSGFRAGNNRLKLRLKLKIHSLKKYEVY